MNKSSTLHFVSQTLLNDLIEIRKELKKSLLEKFKSKEIENQEILDTVSLFMELNDRIDKEVNARIRSRNIHNLFKKKT
jgi:hypothetical protein